MIIRQKVVYRKLIIYLNKRKKKKKLKVQIKIIKFIGEKYYKIE